MIAKYELTLPSRSFSWQTLIWKEKLIKALHMLVSQNIFADIWPRNLCSRYIQNKAGAAAEWNNKTNDLFRMIFERKISHSADKTTVQSLKQCSHISAEGDLLTHEKHRRLTKSQTGQSALLTHKDRCVRGECENPCKCDDNAERSLTPQA